MTTLNIISEQISRIYSRYLDRDDERIDLREIKRLVSQVVNRMFKIEHLELRDINGTGIGTYEYVRQEDDDTFYILLGVSPISLPKEMGIHRVYKKGCPWKPYIPIRSGDFDIAQGTPSQYIEGQVGYYLDGKKIRFTSMPAENLVVKKVVNDPENGDPNLPLPVPADMEADVITSVLQMLGVGQISQAELNAKHERDVTNERER